MPSVVSPYQYVSRPGVLLIKHRFRKNNFDVQDCEEQREKQKNGRYIGEEYRKEEKTMQKEKKRKIPSSGMLSRVALVGTDVSWEPIASIINC
jgi:hypothetical protein